MCGIFGVVSDTAKYSEVKAGLENLAYRGYDSAGVTVAKKGFGYVATHKVEGHPKFLPDVDINGHVAIGHNRWATHSPPTKENSHPYTSMDGKISLVHNGIIENYTEVRKFLESKGFTFYSETDTEVLPNLIQYYLSQNNNDMRDAMRRTAAQVVGAFGVIFIHSDRADQLHLMKLGSPMYVGKSETGIYICSDAYSFPQNVTEYSPIDDNKILVITKDYIDMQDIGGQSLYFIFDKKVEAMETYQLGEYKHYMEKEIFEQVDYSTSAIAGRLKDNDIKLGGVEQCLNGILDAQQVIFTGCGSAFNAAQVGCMAMEEVGKLICRGVTAGELKYLDFIINDRTWMVTVSQSGETADVIGCLKKVKANDARVLGVVNTPNSTIYQMTDCGVHIRAGKEVSVASTKAVTNQIIAMLLLAYKVGLENGATYKEYRDFCVEMKMLPLFINSLLADQKEKIKPICEVYKSSKTAFVIGRNVLEPIANEIALKIKEISYIHAEGYSGSELKHGPLALIDNEILNICLLDRNCHPEKTESNIEEIRARGGRVVLITNYEEDEVENKIYDHIISVKTGENKYLTAILFNIVGQLMSYYLALLNDRNVDLPRNLAKSVTVE